jgi:hypothetical protein
VRGKAFALVLLKSERSGVSVLRSVENWDAMAKTMDVRDSIDLSVSLLADV